VTSSSGGDVPPASETAEEHTRADFMAYVLNDVQNTWRTLLPASGGPQYQDAKLVFFRDGTDSGCGQASADVGPFYCPVDHKAYLDLGFFDELATRFGANGDFAQAYVLAHELGHHVQFLLGTDARVRQLQEAHPDEANQLSVRLELQADCYAGVWANQTNQKRALDVGDVDEALAAASAVGDDRLQKQATGRVRPDTFTHGTAAQRSNWFKRGFTSGRPDNCDTFAGAI
jgi:predicted metalloprotease